MKVTGSLQKKILLLLLGGLALGCSYSPSQSYRVIRYIKKEWKRISKQSLERAISSLYESKLIDMKPNQDGSLKIVLTKDGEKQALVYNMESFKIKEPVRWDKQWRIVFFDIPEERREVRDVFRAWLKRLNFYKLQNSVFVHPYECRNEFNFLVELHSVRKYVRFATAIDIDNESHLKKIFKLQ